LLFAALGLAQAVAPARLEVRVIHMGQAVRGLKWSDFKAEQRQGVCKVLGAVEDAQPLDLVLVLDTSGLMSERLDYVQVNAELAISHLEPKDRAAVIAFADKASIRAPFSNDADTLLRAVTRAIDANDKWAGGDIDAAIMQAADFVSRHARPDARRVILFITSNMHYREGDPEKIEKAVFASDAVLSAIFTAPDQLARNNFKTEPQLHADIVPYVKVTGGDILDGQDAGLPIQALLVKYRSRYILEVDAEGADMTVVTLSDIARKNYPAAEVRTRLLPSR
jgi:hypothetical protein